MRKAKQDKLCDYSRDIPGHIAGKRNSDRSWWDETSNSVPSINTEIIRKEMEGILNSKLNCFGMKIIIYEMKKY